jgi:hypothetical protein
MSTRQPVGAGLPGRSAAAAIVTITLRFPAHSNPIRSSFAIISVVRPASPPIGEGPSNSGV